jgi:hypothetical protein
MISKRGWKLARLGVMVVAMVLTMTFVCQAATVTGFTVRKVEANEQVEIHLILMRKSQLPSQKHKHTKAISRRRDAICFHFCRKAEKICPLIWDY